MSVAALSSITLPAGINIFVLPVLMPDVTIGTRIRGVLPFCPADVVGFAILAHGSWISLSAPTLALR